MHSLETPLHRKAALAPLLLAALALATGPAFSQDAAQAKTTPAPEALPDAAQILDDYVTASGGTAAYDKIRNRVVKGTFEIVSAGLTASLSVYAAKPNKMYTLVEAEALGRIERGTDGETVWEITTMTGPVVKDDPEKAEVLKDAIFDRNIYWRDNFKSVKTLELADVDGRPCYKVLQVTNSGSEETYCYDVESHLMAKAEQTIETQMGAVPVEAYPSEFKAVDGVILPHLNTIKVMGQTRTIHIDTVEQNVDLPQDRFDLPPDIRSMVEGEDAES